VCAYQIILYNWDIMTVRFEFIFDQTFPSDINLRKKNIDLIINKINESGKTTNISMQELYLIIDESITNAMEHGNRWNPEKKVHVQVRADEENLIIRIADEGKGFNVANIFKRHKKRNILSIRGRGIYIINQFCCINWNKNGNEAELKIKLISDQKKPQVPADTA